MLPLYPGKPHVLLASPTSQCVPKIPPSVAQRAGATSSHHCFVQFQEYSEAIIQKEVL